MAKKDKLTQWLKDVQSGKIPTSAGMAILPTENESGEEMVVIFQLPSHDGYPISAQAASPADMLALAMNIVGVVRDMMREENDDDASPTEH